MITILFLPVLPFFYSVDCGLPPVVSTNLTISVPATYNGSIANYSCENGTKFTDLADFHEAVCQEDGTWTSFNATCAGEGSVLSEIVHLILVLCVPVDAMSTLLQMPVLYKP